MAITCPPQHHHRGRSATESEPPAYPENIGVGTFGTGESDPPSYPEDTCVGTFAGGTGSRLAHVGARRRWTGRSANLPSGRARRDIRRYGASRHKRPEGR